MINLNALQAKNSAHQQNKGSDSQVTDSQPDNQPDDSQKTTDNDMNRLARSVMALESSSIASQARVPIPKNGVDYRGKIVLAPMVRSGELPSRLVSLKYGADLVWGPETIDRSLIGAVRRINPRNNTVEFTRVPSHPGPDAKDKVSVIYRIDPAREKGKLVFQLGTASPELAVEAAKVIADDVSGIDVNAGCPKPFSTLGGMGAALLQTPDKLISILEALVREVGRPWQIGISVKIRLLKDPKDTERLVTALCATGITGLTVHCRTTPMRPREAAIRDQLPMIVSICRSAGVACLMNGDVKSRDHALELMSQYDVDGAMIATSAESNFSCFRSAADGGCVSWRELAHEYVAIAMECENKWGNTKYLLNIFLPGKDKVAQAVKSARTYTHCCTLLGFNDLLPAANKIDAILGISDRTEAGLKRSAELLGPALLASATSTATTTTPEVDIPLDSNVLRGDTLSNQITA
ncbi:hypothetical protein A7D00_6402 [Trichophyton violaceum]|uniref:DUS-like FMN-binding domain-containing protein n=1 Tax=Trichophyton violaceum TaxID=34388 RepID=A0A178FC05_TRIVO|nr:hypothetical protein A7D00_6402 [Trichophyton violaceum]